MRRLALAVLLCAGCSGPAPATRPATEPPAAGAEPHPGPDHPHHHKAHDHGKVRGHRFERADEWVARFEGPDRDAWQKPAHVIAVMKIRPGMKVVDIGAGTGYFLPHLSRAVGPTGSVAGHDIEKDMVRYQRERIAREKLANASSKQVQPDDPGLAPGSTDRVLIVNTWHHIQDRVSYAKKLAAGLAPAGAVYIVDFTMESKIGPPRQHRLEPTVVIDELQKAGLRAELAAEELPNQYIVVGRR